MNRNKTLLNQHYLINGGKRQRHNRKDKIIACPVVKAAGDTSSGSTTLATKTVASLWVGSWWGQSIAGAIMHCM